MTEAVESQAVVKSPLDAVHEKLGATMTERDGSLVPQHYGDVSREYAAVREGVGLIDLSSRGRFLVGGSEAVQFLNGLITNDMKTLAENHWMPAAFPNVQGRLIASVRVVRLRDEGTDKNVSPTFIIDTEAATHQRVHKTIERFTLAGDFRVTDITNDTGMLSLQGAKGSEVVRSILNDEVAALQRNEARVVLFNQEEVTVIRSAHFGVDGFDLIVKQEKASELWRALQEKGALPVGYEALETLRIEAGVPRFGVDMDDTNIVTETNLDDSVSYTKGCYVGQEIIARIKYRGHVAKKLTGLRFDGMVNVKPGASIKSSDGKEVGRITSLTDSPRLNCTIALGYVKYDYLAVGTNLRVGDEELPVEVSSLPFVARSPAAD
jgi:folate-binding protein YgfZ